MFHTESGPPASQVESGPPALHIVPSPPDPAAAGAPKRRTGGVLAMAAAFLLLAASAAGAGYWWVKLRPLQAAAQLGSVTIESVPAGAEVFSGGELKGQTPLTLNVPAGDHSYEVVHAGTRRTVRAAARPGTALVHHVQFDAAAAAASAATLEIATDPAKLRVSVNGTPRGLSPLVLTDLPPGRHSVQVQAAAGTIERAVELEAGKTASLLITAGSAAGPAAGWLAVAAPVSLQVLERGELLGTSDQAKIMLPSGQHELVLTNPAIGFTEKRVVRVPAGSQLAIRVDLPKVPLSINALPWAEAWIDGTRIGETPIANHLVTLGPHEIVFRHPEFGERRQTVTVGLGAPARVSVDMRRPRP